MTSTTDDAAQRTANRLARETSPYLLQHAFNPVDWYPWGQEAIEAARRLDRPIFLSIGYSTCYWCHVMERESFEDERTAAILNSDYIAIKVDREERPDVDEVYMTACQVFTQITEGRPSGGWPLSVFIDPVSLAPFHVGTYYPPAPAFGRPSFSQVLEAIAAAWRDRRDEVLQQGHRLAELVGQQVSSPAPRRTLGPSTVDEAINTLMSVHDRRTGGFGGAPRFPQPVFLELLIASGWERPPVREAVVRTAVAMALGGIHDQVGGGFHRYSVDENWVVPHFEKMLYDNGQLACLYAALYERTRDPLFERTLRDTLEWVRREMTAPQGGFFSAQDAEVGAREGASYVWTPEEVVTALEAGGRASLAPAALAVFGLNEGPNFRDPHHPDAPPVNVLVMADRPEALATSRGVDVEAFLAQLDEIRQILLDARNRRPQPLTDDKILAGWNGLMISGFAEGGRVLNDGQMIETASRAAAFILDRMRDTDGGLLRVHREGASRIPAFLEDYALLARGLLDLHRASGEERWLTAAEELVADSTRRFRNEGAGGGYFDVQEGASELFVRPRTVSDGALPGGSTTMINVLLDLNERTGDRRFLMQGAADLATISGELAAHPVGAARGMLAVLRIARVDADLLPRGEPAQEGTIVISVEPNPLVLDGLETHFAVTIELPEGVHVNAHEPAAEGLVGLALELAGGDDLELDVRYPPGGVHHGAPATVAGTVRIDGTVRRRDISTSPQATPAMLRLTFQPCTADACLEPVRRAIPLEVR